MRQQGPKILCIAAIFCGIGLAANASQSQQMTVSDLQQICSGRDAEDRSACKFFILGVVEGASFGKGAKTVAGPLCIAENISSESLEAAVKRAVTLDLAAYPDDRSLAAAGFIAAAAMNAFPCSKSN